MAVSCVKSVPMSTEPGTYKQILCGSYDIHLGMPGMQFEKFIEHLHNRIPLPTSTLTYNFYVNDSRQ